MGREIVSLNHFSLTKQLNVCKMANLIADVHVHVGQLWCSSHVVSSCGCVISRNALSSRCNTLLYLEGVLFFLFRVKEACILLNLLPGSAVLLRDLLKSSETTENEREGDPSSSVALQDTGVYRLTPEDALKVLDLRIHLPNVK